MFSLRSISLTSSILAVFIGYFHLMEAKYVNIKMELGEVIGKTESIDGKTVNVFLGVPYGLPPVGENRFKKTRAVEKYTEPVIATSFGPGCFQIHIKVLDQVIGFLNESNMSEDCLRLNIWSPINHPDSTSQLKPVLVWFFGGGHRVGWSNSFLYNGLKLSSLGDVVVVTLNYRVGALGFLTLGSEEAPGNLALYDQNCALKWINKYIHHFGGNPNEVTLFGQSSGATCIGFHMISPLSSGLFKRAILESGTPNIPFMTLDIVRNLVPSVIIAARLNCVSLDPVKFLSDPKIDLLPPSNYIFDCLRGKSPEEITKAEFDVMNVYNLAVLPTIGEEFLPLENVKHLNASHTSQIEIIIGLNEKEGDANLQVFLFHNDFGNPFRMLSRSLAEIVSDGMLLVFGNEQQVQKYTRKYFEGIEETDVIATRDALSKLLGDWLYLCPAVFFADVHSSKNPNVYFYYYTHESSHRILSDWMEVTHLDELPFVFGIPFLHRKLYNEYDRAFSREMMKMWSSFAKGSFREISRFWPKYSSSNPQVLELKDLNFSNRTRPAPKYQFCYDHWKSFQDTQYLHVISEPNSKWRLFPGLHNINGNLFPVTLGQKRESFPSINGRLPWIQSRVFK